MANYSKSFNFRNGVQVDDDNLVVDTLGKVGIGTSVPSEFLDVRGNAVISGFTTASDVYSKNIRITGIITASTLTDGKVTISSGIITASSGVVTYYGDGGKLSNLPTSQWIDTDVGLGFTSIYANGFVGISTNDPRFSLQVGGNNTVNSFSGGVGINSGGDILATGIITATTVRAALAATFLTGTIDNGRLPSNISVSGIVTATGGFVGSLTGTATTAQFLTGSPNIVVGIITASSLNSAGLITATGVTLTNNAVIGGFASIGSTVSIGSSLITGGGITVSGNADISGNSNVTGILTAANIKSGLSTTGISTVHTSFHVGTSGTFFAVTSDGKIGIGSQSPTSDLLLRKTEANLVEVISETGESRISIGQSVGVGNSSATIRFGNTQSTLDILNRSTGGFNNYIHAGGSGIGTGNFNWIYGQNNAELMTLTYGGRLGLGKTNPDNTLHVVGTSTITGAAWFGGNVTITGTLSAGTITLPSMLNGTNINTSSGLSTFRSIEILDNLIVNDNIGIGTTNPIVPVDAREKIGLFGAIGINTNLSKVTDSLVVGGTILGLKVGVGTTATRDADISLYGNIESYPPFQADSGYIRVNRAEIALDTQSLIGVGTTGTPNSAVDFSNAGSGIPGNISRQMIVPRVTSAERAGIRTERGGIIYNTTLDQLQGAVQVGTGNTQWVNLGITTAIIDANQINVSGASTFSNSLKVGTGVTIQSGIVTATNGFLSGIGTAVKITTVGNQLIFTVPGVGTTSFTLF